MGLSFPKDKQKRAIIFAVVASIVAAAATMLIPVSVLERIFGVTGLSEIIPATGAPLGDTARALIAFGAGALTMAIMVLVLGNGNNDKTKPRREESADNEEKAEMLKGERLTAIKDRLTNFNLPDMPWKKADNDVRDLADLPNVRVADRHPDAPPRHPLSVSSEMASDGSAANDIENVATAMPAFEEAVSENSTEENMVEAKASPEISDGVKTDSAENSDAGAVDANASVTPAADEPESLESMIARLESSMAKRGEQLSAMAEMSDATAETVSPPASALPSAPMDSAADEVDFAVEDRAEQSPPIEAVEADTSGTAEKSKEVDTALNAALETLQKMNAQSR